MGIYYITWVDYAGMVHTLRVMTSDLHVWIMRNKFRRCIKDVLAIRPG